MLSEQDFSATDVEIAPKKVAVLALLKGSIALVIGFLLTILAFSSGDWMMGFLGVCSLTFAAIQFSAALA